MFFYIPPYDCIQEALSENLCRVGSYIYSGYYFHGIFPYCSHILSMKKLVFTFFSVALVLVGVIGTAFVGYRAYQESERNRRISEEIRSLEEEANRIDQENRKLRDRIEYLQSDDFREKEAKRVLEYQKSGEKVVLIRDRVGVSDSPIARNPVSNDMPFVLGVSDDEVSNPVKWWREFFERKPSYE